MVIVEKDERKWDIVDTRKHSECDYVFYPNDIHACEYNGRTDVNDEYVECTLENCPLRVGVEQI